MVPVPPSLDTLASTQREACLTSAQYPGRDLGVFAVRPGKHDGVQRHPGQVRSLRGDSVAFILSDPNSTISKSMGERCGLLPESDLMSGPEAEDSICARAVLL